MKIRNHPLVKHIYLLLFVITKDDEYREKMLIDCKAVNEQYKKQEITDKDIPNYIPFDKIKEVYTTYLDFVQKLLNQKGRSTLNTEALFKIMPKFLLLGFLSGASGLPPRRSLDYSEMKIKDFNKDTDNYYDKGVMVFNKYKTHKTYGRVEIDLKKIAPTLNIIIIQMD